jgi:myo-inositol-1(or 4)-monophosphatase
LPEPEGDLTLLLSAAEAAGRVAERHFRGSFKLWDKPGGHGPVTEADLEIDALLRDRLGAARPGYGWLSEESAMEPAAAGEDAVFVIDPIDGTRAFAEGNDGFAHALAVVRGGQPVAAVVHLPVRGLTYAATLGGGAVLNGAPIRASGHPGVEGARVLATRRHLMTEFWPAGPPPVERHFRSSIAWRICLVAEGAFDATLTLRDAWSWDIAAASLVASEAAAVVTDADGAPLHIDPTSPISPGLVVAPPQVHRGLMRLLRPGPSAA